MTSPPATELQLLLDHAGRTVPFYSARFPDTEALSDDRLAELPVLNRGDLRRDQARLWSTQGDPSKWRRVRTSGTTGEPVTVVVDEESRVAEAIVLADHVDWCLGNRAWRRTTLFHATLHVGATSGAVPAPWGGTSSAVKWNLIRVWQASDEAFLTALRHLGGHVVTIMPSAADLIASRVLAAGAAGIAVPLLVVLSGETPERSVRRKVEAAFGCPTTSLYTLAEVGIVGTECSGDGYHFEDHVAVVEILDELNRPTSMDVEGEIVVTSLVNRAMPIIRYRTGDRGRWDSNSCECGRSSPRFVLTGGRQPTWLVTDSGAKVNVVRFAKLLAGLDVNRINLGGVGPGAVRVEYEADSLLESSAESVLQAALRSALGPTVSIVIARTYSSEPVDSERPLTTPARAEPAGPSPSDVAVWLKTALTNWTGIKDVEAAVITGSCLDPEATTRFSDIDVVILLSQTAGDSEWRTILPLVGQLRGHLPALRINVDSLSAVRDGAPLLACRLLREQFPVLGALTTENLEWPSIESLQVHGKYWAQDAQAGLWSLLTDPAVDHHDVLRTAAVTARQSLEALRYYFLSHGSELTASRAVLAMGLEQQDQDWPWLNDVAEAFDVAREHTPPPNPLDSPNSRYLAAGISCIRSVSEAL